jgi:hypothetical protein
MIRKIASCVVPWLLLALPAALTGETPNCPPKNPKVDGWGQEAVVQVNISAFPTNVQGNDGTKNVTPTPIR